MPPNGLTLKQRLAALSRAPSSPSSPTDAQPQPKYSTKRKNGFNQPWSKRQEYETEDHDRSTVDDVMNKVIFQAGVDYETRPMVILNASAMPDPRQISYDLLLTRVLSYLDLYVEADYTVVFFAAGNKYSPGWNWVWKAYRSLSRKYRKNLKKLFIVHSNFFSKMLFSLAGAIISPKFFRKICYVNTLSELAQHVPLTQIDIPPAVYQENLKSEQQIVLPVPTRSNVFGVPLEELMGYDGEKGGLPRAVKDCIEYLRECGLQEDGLFRRSANSTILKQAKEAYDRGQVISLESFGDPYLVAVLLKKYLRDLPEPLFPENMYSVIQNCPPPSRDPSDMSSVIYIRESILTSLPPCQYILLSAVFNLLHEVSLRSALNRMDAHNLAIVITPNLIAGSNPLADVMMCAIPGGPTLSGAVPSSLSHNGSGNSHVTLGAVVKICIQRYYEIFDEVLDRSEALPQRQGEKGAHDSSTRSNSPEQTSLHQDDDEEIDDAMLVMPIGPSSSSNSMVAGPNVKARAAAYARSTHTAKSESGDGTRFRGFAQASQNRSKSMISIEKGGGGALGTTGRRGSISVGRGSTKKASGAGVEAIGVTAEGFFTPPRSAPPVPALPGRAVAKHGSRD